MKHYTEEDLVLYYYRERDDVDEIDAHLESCDECRARHAELEQLLGVVEAPPVPERSEAYPAQVWYQLETTLQSRNASWRKWFSWPRLGLAASVAALLVVAFLAGHDRGRDVVFEQLSDEAREKVLMAAVGQHLERSQRMLVSLVNTEPSDALDLGFQRDQARRLASDNRVYRASAGQSGNERLVNLLEQLERVLIEIANSPPELSTPEHVELWRRIEGSALLVKIKILESETRQHSRRAQSRGISNEI